MYKSKLKFLTLIFFSMNIMNIATSEDGDPIPLTDAQPIENSRTTPIDNSRTTRNSRLSSEFSTTTKDFAPTSIDWYAEEGRATNSGSKRGNLKRNKKHGPKVNRTITSSTASGFKLSVVTTSPRPAGDMFTTASVLSTVKAASPKVNVSVEAPGTRAATVIFPPGNVVPGKIAQGIIIPGNIASDNITPDKIAPGNITQSTDAPVRIPSTHSPGFITQTAGTVAPDNITTGNFAQTENSVGVNLNQQVLDADLNATVRDTMDEIYQGKRGRPHLKPQDVKKNPSVTVPLPIGATSALAKPTKYHYYPHNQHIYLLPECAIQQVCNAVYVRLNYTQPLCACPARYRDPCSASLNADDLHTTRLMANPSRKKAVTLVKTCEATNEMRECRAPRDWSLLALQNVRTGKSHYLVICRCPETSKLEGPMSHDQPTYASVPGIRVYGMMCVKGGASGSDAVRRPPVQHNYGGGSIGGVSYTNNGYRPSYGGSIGGYKSMSRTSRPLRLKRSVDAELRFPWHKVQELQHSVNWD